MSLLLDRIYIIWKSPQNFFQLVKLPFQQILIEKFIKCQSLLGVRDYDGKEDQQGPVDRRGGLTYGMILIVTLSCLW